MEILWYVPTFLGVVILALCFLLLWKLASGRRIFKNASLSQGASYLFRKKFLAAGCCVLFFAAYCGSSYLCNRALPRLSVKLNYEEASKGQNPNKTRFNVSNLLSAQLLEKVIEKGNFSITADQLAGCLELSSAFDNQDITANTAWNIATEYTVSCTPEIFKYGIDGEAMMNLLADTFYEDFYSSYSENDSILTLDFSDMEGKDYMDLDDILGTKASKLKDFISNYSLENATYRLESGGETFSSLAEKIDNFINVELERYRSYILQNGLSKDSEEYVTRLGYQNRILQSDYEKSMAAYDVRLEVIRMYDEQMARIVLVPTTDAAQEYYMSRTKIGADNFANEAETYLSTGTTIQEEIDNNDYAKKQIRSASAETRAYTAAEQMLSDLKEELISLSEQAKSLSDSYIAEKRNGYLSASDKTAPVSELMDLTGGIAYTVIFGAVLCGYLMISYISGGGGRSGRRKRRAEERRAKIRQAAADLGKGGPA